MRIDLQRWILILPAVLMLLTGSADADERQRRAIETTPHFAFYSDLATNLNDALIVAGMARVADDVELFEADERACFDELPPSARAGWNLAVDYYAEIIAPAGWQGRQQFLLRLDLAGVGRDPAEREERDRRFLRIARGFMMAASSAYEQCKWPRQDVENRAWIEALLPRLEAHETSVAERLERHYATPWHGLPILVDVVGTVPRTGANSIYLSPAGGHVLQSSQVTGAAALESVFHEASHTVMRRSDPVPQALASAAEELDQDPGDLWHVLLFYTVGDVVSDALDQAGESYVPMLYAKEHLWSGPWAPMRQPVEEHWARYLDAERSLAVAVTDVLSDLAAGRLSDK